MVVKLVEKYGPKRWSLIASQLKGRIGKQCRERYELCLLSPSLLLLSTSYISYSSSISLVHNYSSKYS